MNSDQLDQASLLGIVPKGRYDVTRLLGVGAFGKVFAGSDLTTKTPVVLKLLQLRNVEARARTERELGLLKKISGSPQVVRLIDGYFSSDAKQAVLISEYVEGPTLQSLVDSYKRGMPSDVVAAIARQLSTGIAYLHGQGIIHRDVKPSNVLVGRDGHVKLVDFGIAVSTANDDDSEITRDGDFVGTMRYAAPEMFSKSGYEPASDVYAVGVTVLFMLLGRQPFEGASFPFLLNKALKGAFIEELPATLKAGWGDVLSAMLLPNPQDRPTPLAVLASLTEKFPIRTSDVSAVMEFLRENHGVHEPPPSPPTPLSSLDETRGAENSLKGEMQSLAAQINAVQAAVADMTTILRKDDLTAAASGPAASVAGIEEQGIAATFVTVRRRLELNWRISLLMTFVLFSLFVAMLVLAVVFSLIYQKSYWGIVFGGTGALSLLTVVIWKPMDKMMFSTIATQQLELIQLNYQRALSGDREERREAFRDVSTQLNSLLTKISAKSR